MSLFTRSRQLPDTEGEAEADGDTAAAAEETRAPQETAQETGQQTEEDVVEQTGAVETADSPSPGWFGWRRRYPRTARGVSVGTTVLAGVLVLGSLLMPARLDRISLQWFLRIPAEAILLAGLLLMLSPRPRRIASVASGVFLGLFTVLKFLDIGFRQFLARPFDLVFDWILLEGATDFLRESFGRSGQVLAVTGVIVLIVAVLVLSTLAVVRLTNVMARHRPVAVPTVLVLATAWITCFTLGVQFGGLAVATKGNTEYLANRVQQVRDGLGDAQVFEKQAAVDAFADTPPDQLLTGLRGKDVLFTFVESYGRVAIDDPEMAPEMDATLKEGTSRLESAGFASRSAWLKSPVTSTATGSPTRRSCPVCGSRTSSGTGVSPPATGRPSPATSRRPVPGARSASSRVCGRPGPRASSSASTTSTTPSTSATRARTSAGRPCPTSSAWRPSNVWSTARRTVTRSWPRSSSPPATTPGRPTPA